MRLVLLPSLVAIASSMACVARSHSASTVSGTVALASFPASPASLAAVDERGAVSQTPLGADGSFSLRLAKGHAYKLSLVGPTAIPLVFPRQTGSLDLSFRLDTDGALLRLGAVRYAPKRPATGFKALAATTPVDCVDCINDDQQVACDDSSGNGDGEPQVSEPETSVATDGAEQADPGLEMAIAEHNAPDEVVGCDDGETDNANQTGEH